MQAGILHEVLFGHSPHHIYVADMLNHRGDGHGYHIHKRFPGKLRQVEVCYHRRKGKPGGVIDS